MDFSLSAEQRELTETAADFARRELKQDLVQREDLGRTLRTFGDFAATGACGPTCPPNAS